MPTESRETVRANPVARTFLVVTLFSCGLSQTACGGTQPASPEDAPATIVGEVVEIEGEGSDVESFVVEDPGGSFEVFIASDVEYGFDLAHLHEHHETGDPVSVDLEVRDGRLVALSIDDA